MSEGTTALTSVYFETDEELTHLMTCKSEERATRVCEELSLAYPNAIADIGSGELPIKLKDYDPAFYAEVMTVANRA